jgi:hypothetical protein
MSSGLQWDPTNAVGKNIATVAMNDTVDCGEALVYLRVYVSLDVSTLDILFHWCRVSDIVLDKIVL